MLDERPRLFFVELSVRDWAFSLEWYQRVLRLEIALVVERDGFALLQAGSVRLALKKGEAVPGTMLLTWEVEDLDGWLAHLTQCGVDLREGAKVSPEGYRRVRFLDPDGHALCLFAWQKS